MFLNNRYYDPQLARFVSVDPIAHQNNPQSLNPYSYGLGNPATYLDPSGLDPCVIKGSCATEYSQQEQQYTANTAGQPSSAGSSPGGTGTPTSSAGVSDGLGGGGGQSWPTSPNPATVLLYDLLWKLFNGDADAAKAAMQHLRHDPNSYFPFTVDCISGDCSVPITTGNVLALRGDNYAPGNVRVIETTDDSFAFLALPGHIAENGIVQFSIYAHVGRPGESPVVMLENIAYSAGGGIEGQSPEFSVVFAGKMVWSQMAAAFRCENAYSGQEQNRRC